jgi:hypothetical protein
MSRSEEDGKVQSSRPVHVLAKEENFSGTERMAQTLYKASTGRKTNGAGSDIVKLFL